MGSPEDVMSGLQRFEEQLRMENDVWLELFTMIPQNYVPSKSMNPESANPLKRCHDSIEANRKRRSRDLVQEMRKKMDYIAIHFKKAGQKAKAKEARDCSDHLQVQASRYLTWTLHFKRQYAVWKNTGKWNWDKSYGTPHSPLLTTEIEHWRQTGYWREHLWYYEIAKSISSHGSDEQGTSSQVTGPSKNALKHRRRRQRANEAKAAKAAAEAVAMGKGEVKQQGGGSGDDGSSSSGQKSTFPATSSKATGHEEVSGPRKTGLRRRGLGNRATKARMTLKVAC
ncbi:hypothetical protein MMC10_008632 [Thelotrema lepadinum]|nr:hypothetical protein [Thelotrema lepadinum]